MIQVCQQAAGSSPHGTQDADEEVREIDEVKDLEEIKLDPEVDGFARWFADWWLRRGRMLVAAASKEDPNFAKKREREDRLPFYWDEETERFVFDRGEGAGD